ncbi:HNH endonuclease family protein [Candidatus Desulfosporosinus infrequens]|uniref:HNH endonuclease family protein n=1 Tax=Candidatus Desulfosporosinus infrequens TaxID=2043169 RepID=A0A2U3LGZ8_9FIRM|nr:HNH endonuclease family protein [Candidatus Desulfosporosinus infrequens]
MKNRFEFRGDKVAIFLDREDGSVMETLIDREDLEIAQKGGAKWHALWSEGTSSFYAISNVSISEGLKPKRLHRLITNCPDDLVVDHVDHDTLNNTKGNLRNVTHSVNMQNRKAECKTNSGFRGVSWRKSSKKWRAYLMINRKQIGLGVYKELEQAVKVVQEAGAKLMSNYIN